MKSEWVLRNLKNATHWHKKEEHNQKVPPTRIFSVLAEKARGEGRNAEWIISYYRDKFRVNFSKIEPLNFRALINSWILADKDSRRLIYILYVLLY